MRDILNLVIQGTQLSAKDDYRNHNCKTLGGGGRRTVRLLRNV